MAPSDSTTWSADGTYTANNTVVAGTWIDLTGTYDASAGTMSLYVNGVLAGTGRHTSTWSATGPFVIGRDKVDVANNAFFNGMVSDVEAYNYSMTPYQVSNLYNARTPATSIS